VTAATSLLEGKVSKTLKSFLKKKMKKAASSSLAVADKSLGLNLKDALESVTIVSDNKTNELFRGIRCYMEELFDTEGGMSAEDLRAMQLGLSHSLSRYKLKFSADKVDTMVIQAVGLLDELDKEINTYAMRVKEWYGWHFPELQAMLSDNAQYSKLVLKCGMRPSFAGTDLSEILEDESLETAVKEAAEVSMGTEIADMDIINIQALAEQVLSMTEYRAQLFEYLKNRMNAIAPNLTILVGELVGARLISHAGSLMNLAKQPASTVQILGAEKALFRALKTKHDTPKYGLIYHASLIGQAAPKNKGKISRVLAAKCSLAIRVDALSDETADQLDTTIGYEGRAKVEARLRQLEGGSFGSPDGNLKSSKTAKYDAVAAKTAAAAPAYNAASDMVMDEVEPKTPKSEKKKKKEKSAKKKRKADDSDDDEAEENGDSKKKKQKTSDEDGAKEKKSAKKEKKKKKSKD
jgi:nucleolar protein 58